MVLSAARLYAEAFDQGLRPDPSLTVSEWADRHRRLSGRAASEPGPWRTARTPYLREIMDCLSPASPVERVVVMKGAQIGISEAGNNWIGFCIHQEPSSARTTKTIRLREKIVRLRQEMQRLEVLHARMGETPGRQISLTDPDARSMATSGRGSA